MTQAHFDLQSQLDSQYISNISDASTTPLCNNSRILFVSPIELTVIERLETTNATSESRDKSDVTVKTFDKHDDTPLKTFESFDTSTILY